MIRADLLMHVAASALITSAGASLFDRKKGALIALSAGLAKEVVWDGLLGMGVPELADLAANAVGIAIVLWGRWIW